MRKGAAASWLIAGSVMELSWLGAWAGFSALAIMGRAFPFPAGCAMFLLAALFTRLIRGRGWRRISLGALHGCAFACTASVLLYIVYEPHPFPVWPQVRELMTAPRSTVEWFILFVNVFWAVLFYRGGVKLAGRRKDYDTVCLRFDLGLAAFFLLFLTKLLIANKAGIKVDDTAPILLAFPFFLFSLVSIGMARTRDQARKSFLPGYGAFGVILSFASVVTLFAAGLFLFFLPALTAATRTGLRALKPAGSTFGSLFLWVIRFMYLPKATRAEPAGSFGMKWDTLAHAKGGWWSELIAKIMGWGLGGFSALVMMALFGMLVFFLVKWLLARAPAGRQKRQPRQKRSWLIPLKAFLLSLFARVARAIKGYERASELFAALSAWGLRSGVPHKPTETPSEFGTRLRQRFPVLQNDIAVMVRVFNEEVYGERVFSPLELRTARSALSRLRSPRHWPARARVRLRGDSGYPPGAQFDSVSAP